MMTIHNLSAYYKSTAELDDLLQEKDMIERRLEQLGYDGDCAYEKAMVAFYKRRLGLFEDLIKETTAQADSQSVSGFGLSM